MAAVSFDQARAIPLADVQVNGIYAGGRCIDFASPHLTLDDVRDYCGAMALCGVEYHVPTIITALPATVERNCAILAHAMECEWGAGILGVHLEGRFLDPRGKGAHDPDLMCAPNLGEFTRYYDAAKGKILWTTTAPIYGNSAAYISSLVNDLGVVVSIGHHAATTSQIEEAFAAGATGVTHAGNGWNKTLRTPQEMDDMLCMLTTPGVYVMAVPDGDHISKGFLRQLYLVTSMRDEQCFVLTADQSPAAEAPCGTYTVFTDKTIEVRASDRTGLMRTWPLSGSYQHLRNAVQWVLDEKVIPAPAALRAASVNPLRFLDAPLRRTGKLDEIVSSGRSIEAVLEQIAAFQ